MRNPNGYQCDNRTGMACPIDEYQPTDLSTVEGPHSITWSGALRHRSGAVPAPDPLLSGEGDRLPFGEVAVLECLDRGEEL